INLGDRIISGEIRERPDLFIFADTDDEPFYVYRQVWELAARLEAINIRTIIVNNGSMHNDLYGGKRFAAMPLFTKQYREVEGFGKKARMHKKGKLKRQCTHEYKIVPIEKQLRSILLGMGLARKYKDGRVRVNDGVIVESWIGYTMDEQERVKASLLPWQRFRYPLIEMGLYRSDCEDWYTQRGLPIPLSSACVKCPLISDARAAQLRDNDPAGYEKRLQFDDDLRSGNLRIATTAKGELFVHDSMIPLREVKLDMNNQKYLDFCTYQGCMT
ncbi:hypothetical protein PZC41_14490, partial [Staphylococcus aureus]|uniref:hypothetical protein n=1 Tax=Staphylococcus aureus TaxID=1280 RepID=UPI0023AE96F8